MTTTHCHNTGKIAYANRPDAAKARDVIMARDKKRSPTTVFQCQHCRLWHIGRKRTLQKEIAG